MVKYYHYYAFQGANGDWYVGYEADGVKHAYTSYWPKNEEDAKAYANWLNK